MPIARIDAQDGSSVLPLREYLETHGVGVYVNKIPGVGVTYHIIMGEADFVKNIIFRIKKTGEKRLAIIVSFPQITIDPEEYQGKIILVDPKEISKETVVGMFEYFFTSEKNLLDLRNPRLTRIIHETKPVAPRVQTVPDQERIGHIMRDIFGENIKPETEKTETKHRGRKKKRRQWLLGILIGCGLMITPLVWYVISMCISGLALTSSARTMITGDIPANDWQSRVAIYWARQGSAVLHLVAVPLSWAGQQEVLRGQERLNSFFLDAATAVGEIHSMVGVGKSVASGFLNQINTQGVGTTPASDITSVRTSLDSVQNTLGLAQAELSMLLKDQTFPFSIPGVALRGTQIISNLSTLRDSAANMDKFVSLFMQLAGFREPKNYLILLQNSAELRPTGGFIGSVAVVSFADGRMTDLQIHDVYTFDGQLKGHVDPPAPVRELLGQEHWYLRDSNWNPDYAESAVRAAWFYQKETGTNVDGVFAVNSPFIVDVLKATGPIDLPDYNDHITAENFYGKALYYTQTDFFPGSTQKKDFLGSLARALITKITTSKTTNMVTLFQAMTTAFAAHDVLMMFGSSDLQSLVTYNGWSGRVPSIPGCKGVPAAACDFDPLIAVEANMGINKANYFITRTLDRLVQVNPYGGISETASITINNTSGTNQGVPYRDYIRFLLPRDSRVADVALDGVAVPVRKETGNSPVIPYYERTDTMSNFYVLGIAIDVPAGSKKQLVVTYTRDHLIDADIQSAVIDFFVQKQPGVDNTPVHTVIQYPDSWTAGLEEQVSENHRQDFIANTGQLEYNTVLDRDSLTRIRFTK